MSARRPQHGAPASRPPAAVGCTPGMGPGASLLVQLGHSMAMQPCCGLIWAGPSRRQRLSLPLPGAMLPEPWRPSQAAPAACTSRARDLPPSARPILSVRAVSTCLKVAACQAPMSHAYTCTDDIGICVFHALPPPQGVTSPALGSLPASRPQMLPIGSSLMAKPACSIRFFTYLHMRKRLKSTSESWADLMWRASHQSQGPAAWSALQAILAGLCCSDLPTAAGVHP